MAITRAVILARGLGTRMRRADSSALLDAGQSSAADGGLKSMIPIGRPFLDHVMHGLADAGITDVCLVIGPEHRAIIDYYQSLSYERVHVDFAIQELPTGTAGAVAAAESFANGAPFLTLNGDNYYPVDAIRMLAEHDASGTVGFDVAGLVANSNIPAERVRQFALLQRDGMGQLTKLVEKPDDATYNKMLAHALVSMNLWAFTSVIFEACKRVTLSERGELELQAAVRIAMSEFGERFHVWYSDEGVLDLSTRGDIASVASVLRDQTVRL